MNKLVTLMVLGSLVTLVSAPLTAAETLSEKKDAITNDAARSAQKGVHRLEEAACTEGDAKCLAEKAKNRLEEAGDATKDKAMELMNKVDD